MYLTEKDLENDRQLLRRLVPVDSVVQPDLNSFNFYRKTKHFIASLILSHQYYFLESYDTLEAISSLFSYLVCLLARRTSKYKDAYLECIKLLNEEPTVLLLCRRVVIEVDQVRH